MRSFVLATASSDPPGLNAPTTAAFLSLSLSRRTRTPVCAPIRLTSPLLAAAQARSFPSGLIARKEQDSDGASSVPLVMLHVITELAEVCTARVPLSALKVANSLPLCDRLLPAGSERVATTVRVATFQA